MYKCFTSTGITSSSEAQHWIPDMCQLIMLKRILTYILIARQRLAKHIPTEAKAWNRTSIATQWHSKHTSLSIKAVFSVWSMPRSYKRAQKTGRSRSIGVESEVKCWASRRQPAGVWAWEQWNWVFGISSHRNWAKTGKRQWKNFMCDLKCKWDW
jgi:hypothetical protein